MKNENNLTLFSLEEMPQTDFVEEKPMINLVQENLAYLMAKKGLSLATIQKETSIPWATVSGWANYKVRTQLLDINIKELADFLDVSVGDLAFTDLRKMDEEKENGIQG